MNPFAYKLVMVEWVDSYGCAAHWGGIEDTPPVAHRCFSVGWLAMESDEALVIVPHMSLENKAINAEEQGCGDMTIPKCAVRKITELKIL